MDQLDTDIQREAAKAAPYEYRVQTSLGGAKRHHRVTAVMSPSGEVRLMPVHKYNAGYVCGGDVPLEATPSRVGIDGQPVEWDVRIRHRFEKVGWRLYRDWLKAQPEGDRYEEILDEVLDRMELDVEGRPTGNLVLSEKQREAIIHPAAREMRKHYSEGKRMADVSRLDQLLGIDSTPVELTEDEKAKAREDAVRSAKKAGMIK